jgi:hypothetical protein
MTLSTKPLVAEMQGIANFTVVFSACSDIFLQLYDREYFAITGLSTASSVTMLE